MKLLSSIKIGQMELKNRVVMSAMHLNFNPDGQVNDKLIEFYRERARGGVGLITVGGCSIDDYAPGMIKISDDKYIPGLAKLTQSVHQEGGKVAAQLYQPGRLSYSFLFGIQPLAPSPVPSKITKQVPKEMTIEDIQNTVRAFGQAAARAKEAGFDAVEAISSAGYIITQFLSTVTNKREDEYGGDFENRMRFGLEVAKSIREAVGPDYPVMFRIGGNDFMPGGNTNREMAIFCSRLEKVGVDAFNVTGGWHDTTVPQITMAAPRGAFTYLARGIREKVNVPVVANNRINDPALAEEILENEIADLVGMNRAMIADPNLVAKVAAGRTGEIRKCIGCNQGCLDHVFLMQPVGCLVNPRAGRELEHNPQPAQQVKNVLVVGGGPGGMEAARVAAERGHRVTLWEKGNRLGGQLFLAAVPPGREEFATIVEYYEHELKRLKVNIELDKEANEENIKSFGADAVVMATGAAPITPPIEGVDGANVIQAWDVLDGTATTGKKVVIIGGGAVGCETAMLLARKGTIDARTLHFLALNNAEDWGTLKELATRGVKDITVVEMQKSAGTDIGKSSRWVIMQEMEHFGVKVRVKATAKKITNYGVVLDVAGKEELLEVDTVILAVGSRSVNELYEKVKEELPEVYALGDCVAPRKAEDAIYQGYKVGESL